MNQTTIMIIVALVLTCLGACTFEDAGAQAADERTPPSCVACHQGERSFVGREADQLAEQIKAIRDATLRHPPLGLADSSDAAIEELAKELSSE